MNLSKIEQILLLKNFWHFFGHFILKRAGAKTDFRKESKKYTVFPRIVSAETILF